jgi:2-polyprenyl-3-methyl-5-hydroxy-6-metoxy-1,4-benzoquinol methylase
MENPHQLSTTATQRPSGFIQNTLAFPQEASTLPMQHTVHYTSCPVCKGTHLKKVFVVEDFSITHEKFEIAECGDCALRFTNNAPDESVIGRYYQSAAYVSHSNTNKGIINRLYHIARRFTLNAKRAFVQKATGKAVGMHLDVGSGTGAFVYTMDKAGWSSIGLEPDEAARETAVKLFKADIFPADHLFSLPVGTYNAITMWHVLEHVHRLDEYVLQLKKLLAPRGKLIIAVPNYTSADAKHYGTHWAAYDVPRHLYHFSPASMRALMERHGLKVVKTKAMWLDSFYVSMLSEKYKNGNILKAIWVGLRSNMNALLKREQCSSLIYVAEVKES